MARGKLKKVRTCVKTLRDTEIYDLKHKMNKLTPDAKHLFLMNFGTQANGTVRKMFEKESPAISG